MPVIRPQHLWMWLLDDWTLAVHRSLLARAPQGVESALRLQWRVGRAVKIGVLLLPLLLIASFLIPGTPLLRGLLQGWGLVEEALLVLHLVVGVRAHASFGWALHHLRPMLFTGPAAAHDLRSKALLAAGLGVFLLASLL
jgi:hypothetical protein